MNAARLIAVLILGVLVGGAVGAVGTILFLRSDAGASLIAQYITTQPQWPDVNPGQSASTTQAIQEFINGSATIPVPKTYASPEYAAALNASLRDVATIAASSSELTTLLTTINNQSLEHNYNGFFDLIVQAKAMVATQSDRVAHFGQDLSILAVANQSTTDAVTKSATQDLVEAGTTLQQGLQTFTASLNELLSGSVPTAAQVEALKEQATSLESQAASFANSSKTLEQHLLEPQQ